MVVTPCPLFPLRRKVLAQCWCQCTWWGWEHGARTVRTVWGNYTAFTPQLDPHRKVLDGNIGTKKKSQEMGTTSVSCSLNLIWIVHSKMIDVHQLFIKFIRAPCQVQIWKTLRGMGMGSECGTPGGGVQ